MPGGRLMRTWSQCSAGALEMIALVASTWPCTRWPPRRSARRTERSRLTGAPGTSAPRPDRSRVSPITSAVKVPSRISVTVRHTPLTATDSPRATPSVEPRMVSLAASPRCSTLATSPSSATIPVNIRAYLLEAQPASGSGGGAGTRPCAARADPTARVLPPIRTFTVGPGISPAQPPAGCGRVADFHRRFGVSPTPEHAFTPISQCATRGIPARTAVGIALRREPAELVADAVLGDQALTVTRAELAPDPADVHVHGAAVPRDGLAVPSGGPAPGSLDQIRAGEHRGRVRAEEGQQLELPEGQLDLAPVGPDAALRVVQAQPGTLGAPAAWRGRSRRRAGVGGGGRGDRVADDGQRRPGARDRHHREQRPVPSRRNLLVPGPGGSGIGAVRQAGRS